MKVSQILDALDFIAPPYLKYGNDPTGLLIGDPEAEVTSLAVALDVTTAVVQAAKERQAQMIIAHHPLIYHPLKSLRMDAAFPAPVALECARQSIAVACAHTNWDIAPGGVNDVLAHRLELLDVRPLHITYREPLVKIAVYITPEYHEVIFDAMSVAGAGEIASSKYDRCGFWSTGKGTFRALPGATPFVGAVGRQETASEERLEMICSEGRFPVVIAAMRKAHPYEEVAYDVYPLRNTGSEFGLGRVGVLPEAMTPNDFLRHVRKGLDFDAVRMGSPQTRMVKMVAVGGGACAEFAPDAIAAGADAYVTSDVRHHEFVDAAERGLLLLDAGHSATETPGTEELARRLASSLPGLAVSFHAPDGDTRNEYA